MRAIDLVDRIQTNTQEYGIVQSEILFLLAQVLDFSFKL